MSSISSVGGNLSTITTSTIEPNPIQSWTEDKGFFDEWRSDIEGLDPLYAAATARTLWCLYKRLPKGECKRLIAPMLYTQQNGRDTQEQMGLILAMLNEAPVENVVQQLQSFSPHEKFIEKIQASYIAALGTKLASLCISFPGYTDQTNELIITTEVSRFLAEAMIDDTGKINRGAAEFWKREFKKVCPFIPTLHKKQIDLVLYQLLNDSEFNQCLFTIGKPHKQLHTDLLIQLKPQNNGELSEVEARKAVLGALLSYSRQERSDCFAQSLTIGVLQHDPKILLQQLKELIEKGDFPTPALFPKYHVSLHSDWTFHCPYAAQSTTSEKLLSCQEFKKILDLLKIKPIPAENPTDATTPRHELGRLIVLNFPRSEQRNQRQALHRIGLNLLSSYFQNHLLQHLTSHAIFISDNCLKSKNSPRSFFLSHLVNKLTSNNPLQPLKKAFLNLLQNRLYFKRIDQEADIDILKGLGMARERILENLAGIYYFSTMQNVPLSTWELLGNVTLNLLKDSLTVASSADSTIDQVAVSKALSALTLQELTNQLKQLLVATAAPKKYPDELLNSNYCNVAISGGMESTILDNFLKMTPKYFTLNETNAERALCAMAALFKTTIDPKSTTPPLVLCRLFEDHGGHIYTMQPFHPTLYSLWGNSSSEQQIRDRVQSHVIKIAESRNKLPLTNNQKLLMCARIKNQFKINDITQFTPIQGFSETGIHPAKVIKNWRDMGQKNSGMANYLPGLQMALNEAAELVEWGSWTDDLMKHVVHQLTPENFPPHVTKDGALGLLMEACEQAHKDMIQSNDTLAPFGMTVHLGAKVLFAKLQAEGFRVDYSDILWVLCDKLQFPLRFQIGDTNYTRQSGKKEIWVGPNYGNDNEPMGFLYADGAGNFLTDQLWTPRIDYLYIQTEQKSASIQPHPKV